jgi:hypothetical protein
MFHHKLLFACILSASVCAVGFAQLESPTRISLSVDKGFPLQVTLTEKLRYKENETVRATLAEPVFSFDREVIPRGSQLEGTITALSKPGKWARVSGLLSGNFTSPRVPHIMFHTLILDGGKRIPIDTYVIAGMEGVARSDNKKLEGAGNALASTSKKSKKDLLKKAVVGLSPFQSQQASAGSRLTAVLQQPVEFGVVDLDSEAFADIGSEIPSDTIVTARLVTALGSKSSTVGSPVEARLIRPLFSQHGRLIYPVGSRLLGTVTEIKPARSGHHNGQVSLSLTTISPPDSGLPGQLLSQNITGELVSLQVNHEMKNLVINKTNTARIVDSKKRWIAPAWALIKAERSFGASADSFDEALLGAYRGKFLKQFAGGAESGLGLPASISGAMFPPVGIGLSLYGAARSIYTNFLGRGRDLILPETTEIEIRLSPRKQATQ